MGGCLCCVNCFGTLGFPCSSAGKESTCNAGDLGSIPGLGRSPGEGKGYPLQYSGLENSMDCILHGVAKSRTRLSDFHLVPWCARVSEFLHKYNKSHVNCFKNKSARHTYLFHRFYFLGSFYPGLLVLTSQRKLKEIFELSTKHNTHKLHQPSHTNRQWLCWVFPQRS